MDMVMNRFLVNIKSTMDSLCRSVLVVIFYRRLWLFLFPHLCVRAAVSYFSLEILGGEIGAKSTEIDLLVHAQRMTADQRKKYNSQRHSWYSRGILIELLYAIWFPLCCDSHSTSWPLQETSRSGHHKRYTRNLWLSYPLWMGLRNGRPLQR